jgi:hypothetical protein
LQFEVGDCGDQATGQTPSLSPIEYLDGFKIFDQVQTNAATAATAAATPSE